MFEELQTYAVERGDEHGVDITVRMYDANDAFIEDEDTVLQLYTYANGDKYGHEVYFDRDDPLDVVKADIERSVELLAETVPA